MKHPITYALDLDVVQEIQRLAVAEERSRSNVANRLLRAALATETVPAPERAAAA
jgi:plasmid stability protein